MEQDTQLSASGAKAENWHDYDADNPALQKRVSELMDRYMKKGRNLRQHFERDWFKAILYYAGHQWLDWSRGRKQYVSKPNPPGMSLPVTNIYAEKIDDNVSSLIKEPPEKSWVPETDDPDDIATAEIADRVDEVIAEESQRDKLNREVAAWAVMCGSGFMESWYDNDERYGTVFVQSDQCQNCGLTAPPHTFRPSGPSNPGMCPQCGSGEHQPAFEVIGAACPQCGTQTHDPEEAFQECKICTLRVLEQQAMAAIEPDMAVGQEALGTQGDPSLIPGVSMASPDPAQGLESIPKMHPIYDDRQPQGDQYPRGKIICRARSPFEVFVDHARVRDLSYEEGLRWLMTVDIIDPEEAEELYGYKQSSSNSKGSSSYGGGQGTSETYRESLAMLSSNLGLDTSNLYSGSQGVVGGSTDGNVVVETLWMLPNKEFPDGLRAVRVNGAQGKVCDIGPIPTKNSKGMRFIPISHARFKVQSGRFWGKSLAADLIPLQSQRNITEAMMIAIERRMAMPSWVIPVGLIVGNNPSGEPGEIIKVKTLGDGSQNRSQTVQKLDGIPPSNYFMSRIESLDLKMEQLSGSFGIAGGEPPKGVTAASAIAILVERQQQHISAQASTWEKFTEEVARQQMDIFRQFAVDERIRAIRGRNSVWKTERWSAADLSGNINVKVEPGSSLPQSNAAKRANTEALMKSGAVDMADPKARYSILQEFGATHLVEHQKADELASERENDKFWRLATGQAGGDLPMFDLEIDNHPVHLERHMEFAKSDDFLELRKREMGGDRQAAGLVAFFRKHIQEHKMAVIQEQQAMQAMMGQQQPQNGMQGDWKPGPGRPDGTGNTLSRGRRAPSEEEAGDTRAVMEPGTTGR